MTIRNRLPYTETGQMYIIYYTESNGNRYAEAITDNLNEWIKHHNSEREDDDREELDDFEIETINYFKFNLNHESTRL